MLLQAHYDENDDEDLNEGSILSGILYYQAQPENSESVAHPKEEDGRDLLTLIEKTTTVSVSRYYQPVTVGKTQQQNDC